MKKRIAVILAVSALSFFAGCGSGTGTGTIFNGSAHIAVDAAGARTVVIDTNEGKAGELALKWMTKLSESAGEQTAPEDGAQTTVWPSVSVKYDSGVFNYTDLKGEIIIAKTTLNWTGPNGVPHSETYNAFGNLSGTTATDPADIQTKFLALIKR